MVSIPLVAFGKYSLAFDDAVTDPRCLNQHILFNFELVSISLNFD